MGEYLKGGERSGATEDVMQLNFGRKRKMYCELENEYCGDVELRENALSPAAVRTYGCCKYEDELMEYGGRGFVSPDLKNVDWQSEGFGTEISTSMNSVFGEATPTSELCGDSEQDMLMDSSSASTKKPSSPPPASPCRKISASVAKKPPAEELEEFFAESEKYVQKRFDEKYNYDIVKDLPLEGRYQWVRLHP